MGISGKGLLRAYCQWTGLVVGILTSVGFFIHFFNGTREGVTECTGGQENVSYLLQNGDKQDLGLVSCLGPFLRWSIGADGAQQPVSTVGDINYYWRKTFTFKPQEFLDLWTPGFLGVLQVLQHFGKATRSFFNVSRSWWIVLFYNVILAFWAQFGYAGNFGVFVGFYSTCAWLPFVLLAAFIDPADETGSNCVLNLGEQFGLNKGEPNQEPYGQEDDEAQTGNEA